jgi:hypothetical protein
MCVITPLHVIENNNVKAPDQLPTPLSKDYKLV